MWSEQRLGVAFACVHVGSPWANRRIPRSAPLNDASRMRLSFALVPAVCGTLSRNVDRDSIGPFALKSGRWSNPRTNLTHRIYRPGVVQQIAQDLGWITHPIGENGHTWAAELVQRHGSSGRRHEKRFE
jgi:hypothetical protein